MKPSAAKPDGWKHLGYRRHLGLVVALLGFAGVAGGAELTIQVRTDTNTVAAIDLKIEGDLATTTVAGGVEQFNLRDMSWRDDRTGRWISFAQCQEWARQSKAKMKRSADAAPAHVRDFFQWSLKPKFKVAKSDGVLRLTSGQVDYVIEGEASKTGVDAYFRYAVLNAYKKAMTEGKFPPFAELKAIEEMKRLGRIPERILVTIPVVPGSSVIELTIRQRKP